jgi:hypothetical protein
MKKLKTSSCRVPSKSDFSIKIFSQNRIVKHLINLEYSTLSSHVIGILIEIHLLKILVDSSLPPTVEILVLGNSI